MKINVFLLFFFLKINSLRTYKDSFEYCLKLFLPFFDNLNRLFFNIFISFQFFIFINRVQILYICDTNFSSILVPIFNIGLYSTVRRFTLCRLQLKHRIDQTNLYELASTWNAKTVRLNKPNFGSSYHKVSFSIPHRKNFGIGVVWYSVENLEIYRSKIKAPRNGHCKILDETIQIYWWRWSRHENMTGHSPMTPRKLIIPLRFLCEIRQGK